MIVHSAEDGSIPVAGVAIGASDERLADELMDNVERFARDWSEASEQQCAEALDYLGPRIAAMVQIRTDETMSVDPSERDHEWLGASKQALRLANAARHQIVLRQNAFVKQRRLELANADTIPAFDALKKQLREELGRPAYDALWERVYQRNPMLRLRLMTKDAA